MNPEQEKARQSAEAEMNIYTPHRVIQEKCDNVAGADLRAAVSSQPAHFAAGITHRLRDQPVSRTPETGAYIFFSCSFAAQSAHRPYKTVFV